MTKKPQILPVTPGLEWIFICWLSLLLPLHLGKVSQGPEVSRDGPWTSQSEFIAEKSVMGDNPRPKQSR